MLINKMSVDFQCNYRWLLLFKNLFHLYQQQMKNHHIWHSGNLLWIQHMHSKWGLILNATSTKWHMLISLIISNGVVIYGPHWMDSKYNWKTFFKGVTKETQRLQVVYEQINIELPYFVQKHRLRRSYSKIIVL